MPGYNDACPTCRETHATFRLTRESGIDGAAITEKLRLEPSDMSARTWLLESENEIQSLDTRRHIDHLLDQLEPRRVALETLRSQGYSTDVFCYWVSAGGHGGPTVSPEQAGRLADLGIELGFDVYFEESDAG